MIYQTDTLKGYWYWNGSVWVNQSSTNTINNSVTGSTSLVNDYVIPNNNNYYWGEAIVFSSGTTYNGFSHWHIPNYDEMIALLSKYGTSIFGTADPVAYWTSSMLLGPHPTSGNSFPYPYIVTINSKDFNSNDIGPIFSYGITTMYNAPFGGGQQNPTKAKIILVR
jgi:hypothetical protein